MPKSKKNRERTTPQPEDEKLERPEPETEQEKDLTEKRLLHLEPEDANVERDLAEEQVFDTQHGEGHTYNIWHAQQQGLTYTPPTDPPITSSQDRPEGVEMAAGFAPSMEASDPEAQDLQGRVAHSDLEIRDRVYDALRYNSETANLTNIEVRVEERVVHLVGTVPGDEDLALVYSVVSDLEDVARVESHLRVE